MQFLGSDQSFVGKWEEKTMKKSKEYEAPKIRDLEELGLQGQFPLANDTCSLGTGVNTHQPCYGGTDSDICGGGTA
jgi:hypothetical protein